MLHDFTTSALSSAACSGFKRCLMTVNYASRMPIGQASLLCFSTFVFQLAYYGRLNM